MVSPLKCVTGMVDYLSVPVCIIIKMEISASFLEKKRSNGDAETRVIVDRRQLKQ